jgi:hypothetical protein
LSCDNIPCQVVGCDHRMSTGASLLARRNWDALETFAKRHRGLYIFTTPHTRFSDAHTQFLKMVDSFKKQELHCVSCSVVPKVKRQFFSEPDDTVYLRWLNSLGGSTSSPTTSKRVMWQTQVILLHTQKYEEEYHPLAHPRDAFPCSTEQNIWKMWGRFRKVRKGCLLGQYNEIFGGVASTLSPIGAVDKKEAHWDSLDQGEYVDVWPFDAVHCRKWGESFRPERSFTRSFSSFFYGGTIPDPNPMFLTTDTPVRFLPKDYVGVCPTLELPLLYPLMDLCHFGAFTPFYPFANAFTCDPLAMAYACEPWVYRSPPLPISVYTEGEVSYSGQETAVHTNMALCNRDSPANLDRWGYTPADFFPPSIKRSARSSKGFDRIGTSLRRGDVVRVLFLRSLLEYRSQMHNSRLEIRSILGSITEPYETDIFQPTLMISRLLHRVALTAVKIKRDLRELYKDALNRAPGELAPHQYDSSKLPVTAWLPEKNEEYSEWYSYFGKQSVQDITSFSFPPPFMEAPPLEDYHFITTRANPKYTNPYCHMCGTRDESLVYTHCLHGSSFNCTLTCENCWYDWDEGKNLVKDYFIRQRRPIIQQNKLRVAYDLTRWALALYGSQPFHDLLRCPCCRDLQEEDSADPNFQLFASGEAIIGLDSAH